MLFFVRCGGPRKFLGRQRPQTKRVKPLQIAAKIGMKSMKPLQIAAKVKMQSMKTLQMAAQTRMKSMKIVANGSKSEDEEHENRCK